MASPSFAALVVAVPKLSPMVEYDIVFRIRTAQVPGTLASALVNVARFGANIGDIRTVLTTHEYQVREVTITAPDAAAVADIRAALAATDGVSIVGEHDAVFEVHKGGKLETRPTVEVRSISDVREVYTPGVARVARAIADDPGRADYLTWKGNTVAVVSDGSRVLGLGDVGPEAALPVMEGKALFYKLLVGLNAVPIVLSVHEPAAIVEVVAAIAPGFGGIHLEDIASPGVYTIEEQLRSSLDVPVMHDDQHGTAVVVLAGVLSAARALGRSIGDMVFGQVGLGAAGSAIARLALGSQFARVVAFDPAPEAAARMASIGADQAARLELHGGEQGFDEVVGQADVLVMTSGRPGIMDPSQVREGSIVFALSNPVPEISRRVAMSAGAALAADGSIVNNVLAYPGLFKGAMQAHAGDITLKMKIAAAEALAELAGEELLPDPLDPSVHAFVAEAVAATARSETAEEPAST